MARKSAEAMGLETGCEAEEPAVLTEPVTGFPEFEPENTFTMEGNPVAEQQNESGFYIYIGPNIKGLIQNGAIFRGTRKDALEKAAPAIEKFKLVKFFLVAGDSLPTARLRMKDKKSAFSVNYKKLERAVRDSYAVKKA